MGERINHARNQILVHLISLNDSISNSIFNESIENTNTSFVRNVAVRRYASVGSEEHPVHQAKPMDTVTSPKSSIAAENRSALLHVIAS